MSVLAHIEIIVTCGAPAIFMLVAVVVRLGWKLPQTTFADILVLLWGFDVVVIIENERFGALVSHSDIAGKLSAIYLGYLILGWLLWAIIVSMIEPGLARRSVSHTNEGTYLVGFGGKKQRSMLVVGWAFIGFAIYAHVAPFLISGEA